MPVRRICAPAELQVTPSHASYRGVVFLRVQMVRVRKKRLQELGAVWGSMDDAE
jgi:hypothetical protein